MSKRKNSNPKHKNDRWCENDISGYIPVLKKKRVRKTNNEVYHQCFLPTDSNKCFLLGSLRIGTTNNIPDSCKNNYKAHFNKLQDCMILTSGEHSSIIIKLSVDTEFVEDIFSTKMFATEFDFHDDVIINIYFKSLPLPKYTKKISTFLKKIFKLFYDVYEEEYVLDDDKKAYEEVGKIYEKIKNTGKFEGSGDLKLENSNLKPTLRPYQEDAVRWMLSRETIETDESDHLHPLYTKIELKSGTVIYYDKYSGFVELEKPIIKFASRGGILGDEMGLGKTLEVFACILSNKMPNKNEEENPGFSLHDTAKPDIENIVIPKPRLNKRKNIKILEPKKLKVDDKFVKGSSKKSLTRLALESYYNAVIFGTPFYKTEDPICQCICSEQIEEDRVDCVECGKYQHKSCMGYKDSFGPFKCSQCWMEEPVFDVGATLIVTPKSLKKQWCNEIVRHIKGKFRVLQYDGSRTNTIYPTLLKEYDLVITTYNVLQNELRLTENEMEKNFRRKRIYSPPGSPLIRVKWWRLCLDEAQTVDAPNSMVSAMSRKLNAHFRWAVTGTPISKDISDIYGLIDYLHITPYNDLTTWTHILYNPYLKGNCKPMCNFLSKVMWRTEKKEVTNQIDIPKQTSKEHALEFSAVEKFFYKKEHEMTRDLFLALLEKMDPNDTIKSLQKGTVKKIMTPLLTLRQACSHPNTTRGKYLATRKSITSLKQLLEALIVKNANECEEMLRVVISNLNGLAGIYLLCENYNSAIEEYRRILQLNARFTNDKSEHVLQVDTLQLIHTMHNLAGVLEKSENVTPTLHDDTLKSDCKKLEVKYIGKFNKECEAHFSEWQDVYQNIEELDDNYILKQGQWYSDGINYLIMVDYYSKFLSKIESILIETQSSINVEGGNFLYIISTWDRIVYDLRKDVIESLVNLYEENDVSNDKVKIYVKKSVVEKALNCHLRPQKKEKKKDKCPLCIASKLFVKYESKLFNSKERKETADLNSAEGSWMPTLEEQLLKSLQPALKYKKADQALLSDCENQIKMIDAFKTEFKIMRKFWTALHQQTNAQDELEICKIRMGLKNPSEENKGIKKKSALKNLDYEIKDKTEHYNLLNIHELAYQENILRTEERETLVKLEKNLGTRKYLQTLMKQQYEGQNPDPCPICKNSLENHWSILSCGHSYCLECIQIQLEKSVGTSLQCSICRSKLKISDISYIKAGNNVDNIDTIDIKGNYSTKIEAVVKVLIELTTENPLVKVLIFSTWATVLKSLKEAFDKNNISCELIANTSRIEDKIEIFKDISKKCTALLLPIHLGAKGLNLIEATHAILVEPILNPADELQAIGRIHRIGQTKETYVHKFVMKNTIEQSIHEATATNSEKWDSNKVTIKQLSDLFISDQQLTSEIGSFEMSGNSNDGVNVNEVI